MDQINNLVSVLEPSEKNYQCLAQQGNDERHLNKGDKIYLKQFTDHVHVQMLMLRSCSSGFLELVCAKIPLSKMCWSHGMHLSGQNGDVWELLDD